MMKKAMTTMVLRQAVLAALIPMAGCAVTARGLVTPPTAVITASIPAPPTITVTAPMPPAVTVAASVQDDGIELGEGQSVYVQTVAVAPPPPPTVVVTTPPARAGFIWVAPHYGWNGARWVWTTGHWIRERAGYVWIGPRFDASRRVFIRGHWQVRPATSAAPAAAPAPSAGATVSSSASFNASFHAEAHLGAD